MKYRLRVLASLIAVFAVASASAQSIPAIVQQPRPFGYVIGDLVTQRVLLQSEGGAFEPAELPRVGQQLGISLERRAVRVETDAQGRRWLAVDYQLMNAPQTLQTVTVPAWDVRSKQGSVSLRIAEWPISVSPLTPRAAFHRGGLIDLLPDQPAPLVPIAPIRNQLAAWSAALALTIGAWAAWFVWRNQRSAAQQPFARAVREIRRMDETSPQAWHALHRAFDATAGRALQPQTLPALFERAPYLESLRPAIERFFAESSARFFGGELYETPAAVSVRSLSSQLHQLERRHER